MILLAVLLAKVFALAALVILYRRRWLVAQETTIKAVATAREMGAAYDRLAARSLEINARLHDIASIKRRVPRRHFIATARRIARAVEGV